MRITTISFAAIANLSLTAVALADGDPKRGAQVYSACVSCHALVPGLHLSGPSLDGIIGRKAGTSKGFVRYSKGLKEAGFSWNATALDGWLKEPEKMVPGTYMAFRGIDEPQDRIDLIAFLEIAGQLGGGKKAVDEGLIPADWVRAGGPEAIATAPPEFRISMIRHCGDSYFITTEDGRETPYWEKNIRLKIDSAETGPPAGAPVLLGAGMQGDRYSVIFASVADLQQLVSESCGTRPSGKPLP